MAFEGQVALVVGGASGIGRATARELLRQGASVALGDVSADAGEEAARQLRQEFGAARVSFLRADVCSEADMEAAFSTTKDQFKRLDIFVNAAGIMNDRKWELEVDINTKGVVRGALLAWKHMGTHHGGRGGVVVNVASIAGLDAQPFFPVYGASKFAVAGLGRALGMQCNVNLTGVRVLTICPGGTDTQLVNAPHETFLEDTKPHVANLLNGVVLQSPDNVAKAILHVIQHGDSGSVWVSENGEAAYEVAFPAYQEVRVTQSSASAPPLEMALEGQVALVVGGAGGMGRATARELLRQGASVALGDVSADASEEAARQLRQEFGAGRVSFLRADVCSDTDLEAAFSATKEQFKRLDIFVNAAGILNDQEPGLTLDVNAKGAARGSLLAWKYMGKHEGGRGGVIVNIASTAGLQPFPFLPVYVASKFAIVGLGKSLGMPLNVDRTGVRVCTVCPGGTDTPMVKMPFTTLLEEMAEELTEMSKHIIIQPAEHVAKTILHVIQHGDSGSVWVCENEEPAYEVDFPAYPELRVTQEKNSPRRELTHKL